VLEGVKGIKAWEHAHRRVLEVYRVTEHLPQHEVYGLTSQLRRAAVSVPANIAEGCQRQYLKEYAQFLYIAKSSLAEVEYYLFLANDLGYMGAEDFADLSDLHNEAAKTLQGLIVWLEKELAGGKAMKKDLHRT